MGLDCGSVETELSIWGASNGELGPCQRGPGKVAPHASASVSASSSGACLWVSSPPTCSLPCESPSSLLCSRAQGALRSLTSAPPPRACRPVWGFGPSPLGPSLSHSANTHLPLSQVGPVWEEEAPWGNQTQPPGKAPRGRAREGRARSPKAGDSRWRNQAEARGLPSASLEPDSPSPPSDTKATGPGCVGWHLWKGDGPPPGPTSRDNLVSVYRDLLPCPGPPGRGALCCCGDQELCLPARLTSHL